MTRTTDEFDFDAWKELAETDPDAFERRRRERVQAAIDLAPATLRPRLQGLQWQIDMTRRRYRRQSTVSSVKLFEMMWDKVYGENGFLAVLNCAGATAPGLPAVPAKILPFRPGPR